MRIRFKDGEQRVFIAKILLTNDISLKSLSKILEINYSTLKNFYREKCIIPENLINRLCSLYNLYLPKDKILETLPENWGQVKGGKKGIKTTFRIYKHKLKEWRMKYLEIKNKPLIEKLKNIKIDENFSEFYGILCGDGCLHKRNSLYIVGNKKLDSHYIINYVKPLIYNLFGIEPHIYYPTNDNSIRCVLYSKQVVKFVNSMGFPIGRKKNFDILIPDEIKNNKKYIKAFIRGMLDTDGCICPQRETNMILDICIMNNQLMNIVKEICDKLDIKFNYTKDRIYLSTVEKVREFFNKIGSSNLRNIAKFDYHLRNGYTLKSCEIEKFLIEYSKINLPYYWAYNSMARMSPSGIK